MVQQYLDRISAYDKTGPTLNAIQHVNARALTIADSLDAVQQRGDKPVPLHCVPVLLKDWVETSDKLTTCGSILSNNFIQQRDATIVTTHTATRLPVRNDAGQPNTRCTRPNHAHRHCGATRFADR